MKTPSTAKSWSFLPNHARLRCVIAECGCVPLRQADAASFDETVVIAQMRAELPAEFAQRALERVANIELRGRYFAAATLLSNACEDAATLAARRAVVLGLATHARIHGGMSELLLHARSTSSVTARFELMGLVEELLALANGRAIPVRLRFDDALEASPTPESGLFPLPRAQ